MGHGYTGNHPRYTMIHDRELIYDAKKQLHRADKALHAYDDKKHAGKKLAGEDQTLMAYDEAATKMLPGKIHPLSDVYGSVRNLEQYTPVDNRAAAKAIVDTDKLGPQGKMVEGIARKAGVLQNNGTSMKDFPLNSPERRAEYDRRNWKQDETTELSMKDKIKEGAKNMVKGVVDTAIDIAPAVIGGAPGMVAAKAVKNMLKRSADGKPNKKGCSYKR